MTDEQQLKLRLIAFLWKEGEREFCSIIEGGTEIYDAARAEHIRTHKSSEYSGSIISMEIEDGRFGVPV